MNVLWKFVLSGVMVTSVLAVAAPPANRRDHQLWDALTRLRTRFNVTAVGEGALIEAGIAGTMSLVGGVAGLMYPERAAVQQFATLSAPVALAGVIVMTVGQYVQARGRHPAIDVREVLEILTENKREAREMWALYQFMRFKVDDQYAFALGNPELRAYLLQLDEWLQSNLAEVPPPQRPAQAQRRS